MTAQVALPQATTPRVGACQVPSDVSRCTPMARLRVGRITMSSPTCFVDARIREGEDGRLLHCPEGVVALFSRGAFGGRAGDSVDACLRTQFPFRDGCTWETLQRVRGGPSVLEYSYVERPISGDSCASSSCTARADIEVYEP